ncbi:GntR family transcriptional regulator [Amnibacterium flavum]|uniref:HTH gntR-type domain-containing protein n=1 Tax=Amnibacterium flavum TaxID=2173173 RepID=A0A2V1HPF1_9MICO|nr:GntR family transcriptional regulator [Amnibacterium flavum]PVZ94513.1 hypothetical protein DDQ50_12495 [Amnibacterium flavum]
MTLDALQINLSLPTVGPSETLPARVHAILEQAIIDGRFEPESRIHADDLAAHFGVSRIPVREALRSLHEAGWVEIRPRYGVRVRSRDPLELDDLFEFRAEVERTVARFAAERRDEDDLAAFAEIVESSRVARDAHDLETLDANGLRLYATLRAAAKNAVMAESSVSLEKRARFYYVTIANDLGLDWTYVHERVVDFIRAGDGIAAGDLIHDHILKTGQQTRELLFR